MMNPFNMDASSWEKFGTELKSTTPVLRFKFRPTVRHWAEVFVAESTARAAAIPSKKPTGRIQRSFRIVGRGDNVVVYAGGPSAPEAAPLENDGKFGTFRHPVFGNREVWVAQKGRPFFTPAFRSVTASLPERGMNIFFDDTFHHIGYV